MEKSTLISVIVPAYNEENKIVTCLKALLSQDYKNIEVFVVDDGSSDKTSKISKRFAKEHKNIFFLQQKRKGPGAAKNLAAKKAKGSILVFVDSDEYVTKTYLEDLTKPIRLGKAETTIGSWKYAKPESPWARCRYKDTSVIRKHAVKSGVFRAIKKSIFLKSPGFNPKKGYSDDRLDYKTKKVRVESAIFLHDVDSALSEIYKKRKWIGSSLANTPKNTVFKLKLFLGIVYLAALIISLLSSFFIFWILILILVAFILLRSLSKVVFYKDPSLLVYYPVYLIVSSIAMFIGLLSPRK